MLNSSSALQPFNKRTSGHLLGLWFLLFSILSVVQTSLAQAVNDNIENRLVLTVNQAISSSTAGNTVQWSCVNEKLTGKCIEYHNDQWFEFTPQQTGRYYINISGQTCRDTRGVQLVVINGAPCQPETYKILSCTSLANQDDIFISLDLLAGKPYLLNLDGYLHDFCNFQLEVSQHAKGQPAPSSLSSSMTSTSQATELVNLKWQLPDSLTDVQSFKVMRWLVSEQRSKLLAVVTVNRNSFGHYVRGYYLSDTLTTAGQYFYQVLATGTEHEAPVTLQQQWVTYTPKVARPASIPLPLDHLPKGANISIQVFDADSGRLLWSKQLVKNQLTDNYISANQFQKTGVKRVRIKVQHHKGRGKTDTIETLQTVPQAS